MKQFLFSLMIILPSLTWAKCDYRKKGVKFDPPLISTNLKNEVWQSGFDEVHNVLCKNLRSPNRFFRGYRAHPGPPYKAAYLWDTAFISQIWMHWDPTIAQELIKYLLRFQEKNGLIHHEVFELLLIPLPVNHTQPPLIAWASWRIYERTQSRVFLDQVYFGLKKYHEWLMKNRRHVDGLFFWNDPYESGIDNSPRFSNISESVTQDTTKQAATDLSSYMALSMESLSKMAMILGRENEAQEFDRQYAALKAQMNEKLWHKEDGIYYDWDYTKNTFIHVNTISNLTPLIAGVPTEAQAKRMMEHVMDPERYNTLIPFPSVAKNDSHYSKDMWSGPVWINMAYLGVKGIDRYGYHSEATLLAKKISYGIYSTFKNEGHIFEFYDPERYDISELQRKKGNLFKKLTLGSKPVKNFVGWSGLANTLVLEYGEGF
jgi:glycogen debranching enzyme